MKKFLMGAWGFMLSGIASTALAAPDSPFFVGVMLGDSTLDIQSKAYVAQEPSAPKDYMFEIQDSQTFTFMVSGGYRFTDMIGIEAQITTSLMDDKIYGAVKRNNSALSEFRSSISAMGVYSVFQFGEEAYFKARAGLAQSTANFEADFASTSYSEADLSFGASIGQKMGELGSIELTFMRYPEIRVSKTEFGKDFSSTSPYTSYTSIRRDLNLEVLMVGYIFQF